MLHTLCFEPVLLQSLLCLVLLICAGQLLRWHALQLLRGRCMVVRCFAAFFMLATAQQVGQQVVLISCS